MVNSFHKILFVYLFHLNSFKAAFGRNSENTFSNEEEVKEKKNNSLRSYGANGLSDAAST